jgi:hypothetical protein
MENITKNIYWIDACLSLCYTYHSYSHSVLTVWGRVTQQANIWLILGASINLFYFAKEKVIKIKIFIELMCVSPSSTHIFFFVVSI